MSKNLCAVATVLMSIVAHSALAQTYPTRPVRLIAGSSPGGGSDVLARLLASKLSEALGQQVVVENRAGASGIIGAELTARAAPDGHTFWIATLTQLISTTLANRLHLAKEFAPVGSCRAETRHSPGA